MTKEEQLKWQKQVIREEMAEDEEDQVKQEKPER